MDYFRSVATVMLEAAEACHHVHDLQILHRDLKPSNLMVDTAGQCWIIDFGLAQFLSDGHSDESEGATRSADLSVRLRQHLTQEDARPGTPPYMAPEQWKKQPVDARTDVWGLGVTLYELLTLRPAFAGSLHDIECKVLSEDPPPAHSLVKSVPRDLEAVCGKALKKDPSARYQTAEEFASDLRHWLAHEPVTARRTRVPRRVWLWARRNRGWAAAIVFFFVACAGVAAGEIRSVRHRALEAERAIMLQRLQGARLMPHVSSRENNWLEDGWGLMRQAAQIRSDDALRDQAAAFLTGISASLAKVMEGFQSSAVAFDADGRRLLIGGGDHDEAKIWDSATDEFQKSGQKGSGPVAFGSDGAAWQLVATGQDHFPLLLWDVAKRRLSRELRLSAEFSGPANGEPRVSLMALAQTGRVAAAAAILKDRNTLLAAWDISDGKVVPQIRRAGREVSAIALSPEGDYLAAGDAKGQITIWPVRGGPAVSLPSARRAKLECLAFGRNRRGRVGNNNLDNWLIAGGDAGGTVTIWDLGRRAPATYCRGSYYDVYALAFSPDGATLASAGRHATRLWDIATGRPLLEFPRGDYMTGLAFSSDGNKVAVSTAPNRHFDSSQQGTMVWDLEHHRGMQALRGLDSQVAHSKVCFSHDGSRVAALSLGWEAAIWDLPSGFLHHLFQVAPGLTADNAGLEFSPDGHKFAVVAGSEARMWDLDTGQSISWQLPEGLVDTLVFDSTGKHLYSLRMETADWIHAPDSSSSYRDYPRVCRVRDLLATPERDLRRPRKKNPTWEAAVFKAGIVAAQASSDGRYLVAMGDPERPGEGRLLKVFQSETGKEVLSMPATGFCLDTTGTLMEFGPKSLPGNPLNSLIEIPSGKLVGFVDPPASSMGPLAHFSAAETATAFGFSLHRMGDPLPLVTLGIDIECSPRSTFNLDGTRLAWGNRDGTVTVCYLAEIQRRLAAIGFGW
jgi:WD40 repeat protein